MLRSRSTWERYSMAGLSTFVVAFLVASFRSSPLDSDLDYFAFTVAILISAVLAGFGPGLFATAIAVFTSAFFFLPPIFSIQVSSDAKAAPLILFTVEGVLVSVVGDHISDSSVQGLTRSWLARYLPGIGFVASVTVVKLLSWGEAERSIPFALYYVTAAASAWVGGFGAGVTATVLGSLCARFFFLEPRYSLAVASSDVAVRVLLFMAEGTVISFLAGMTVENRLIGGLLKELAHYRKHLWRRFQEAQALRTISRDVIWDWDFPCQSGTPGAEDDSTLTSETRFAAWLKTVHPRDRLKLIASLKAAIEQGHPEWSAEYRRLLPGQGYVRVADRAVIIRDNSWNPIRVVGRSVEVAIPGFQDERTYRAFFDSNPHATLLADSRLHILDANDAACDVLGYTRDALRSMRLEQLIPGSSRGMLLGLTQEDASTITFEEDCIRASGEVFRAKINAALVSGADQSSVDRIIIIEEMAEVESRF